MSTVHVRQPFETGGEWSLHWVRQGTSPPVDAATSTDNWKEIDRLERDAGIRDGTPILIDPLTRVDPRLARFLGRSRFSFLAPGTRSAYAKDYRLFFTFLWQRGRYWDEAVSDDVEDYEWWRRRAPDNPKRIGGSKWAREYAAFKLLYGWAVDKGHMGRNPVVFQPVRRADGTLSEAAVNQPKDVRYANVKWVTPRTFRLWRDTGLRGYDRSGLPEAGWRGRNDGRNTTFANLLFESGLRLREAGCLLTSEIPAAITTHHMYLEGTVAAATAKNSERMFYVPADVVSQVSGYVASTRRAAILQAQRKRRYDALPGKWIVSRLIGGRQPRVAWTDERGASSEAPVSSIDARERQRLFLEGPEGLEPMQLWITEGGMPMDYRSWDAVFAAANTRCRQQGTAIRLTPHMCRHSFALKMLVTLQRALDRRFGADEAERDELRKIYGDVFSLVRDLLGHRSEQTTRNIYLEPLNGIRLATILDDTEDLDVILARVAASSRLVMDVCDDGHDQ